MTAQLEKGLILTKTPPSCIHAIFTTVEQGAFTDAEDERGRAFLFERFQSPATFIEVIHTNKLKVRGNHVHQNCDETLYVLSGEIEIYLRCNAHKKHVYKRNMKRGEAVFTPKGIAHALYTLTETEFVVFFDKDPRNDRDRVPILRFP
jgi:quercetin dioxygenase-like cupin family protein